jgi:hypothetical protein
MRQKNLVANLIVLFASAGLYGQSQSMDSTAKEASSKITYYIDPRPLHLDLILTPPPARNSATAAAELAELRRIDIARTLLQITQAWADDQEEDIFVFKTVLGPTLPQRLRLSRLPFRPRPGRMKVRPVVLSRQSIAGRAPIRLTARFIQSAHSIRSPLRTRADIRFPDISSPLPLYS